jgi:DNA-binding Xre family transcriptional regulator
MYTYTLRNRLLLLVTERERATGRRITQKEIARRAGVSEPVIGHWMRNEVRRYDADVIEKLCAYFECGLNDLLYFETNTD